MPDSRFSLWTEFKDRKVFRVSIVYLAVGWAAIEGANTLQDVLDLPGLVARSVFALVLLGFPIAVFLAWAFQLTPDGIRRAEPLRGGGLKLTLAFTAFFAAVGGFAFLAYQISGQKPVAPVGSPVRATITKNSVAVMPFRVSAPDDLGYLGSGLMDLLSARLDGEVGPRAIHPSAVEPPTSIPGYLPREVARKLGAELYLSGSLVGTADSIDASAELTRVSDGKVMARASTNSTASDVSGIADQLVIQLLSLSSGEYRTSIASLTSTSPEALKAYLLGKASAGDGNYEEGIRQLDLALELDKSFALAGIARADAAINAITIDEGNGLQIAWEHRDRLSPRDLDYLKARYPQEPQTTAERIAAYRRITEEQPYRIEGWFWLFEQIYHRRGPVVDANWWPRLRAIGNEILALDPDFAPVLAHYIYHPPHLVSAEERNAIYRKYLSLSVNEPMFTEGMLDELVVGGRYLVLDPTRLADVNDNTLINSAMWPFFLTELTPPDYLPFVESALDTALARAVSDDDVANAYWFYFIVNMGLGRFSEAEAKMAEGDSRIPGSIADHIKIHLSLLNTADTRYGATWVAAARAQLSEPGKPFTQEDERAYVASEIWLYERDSDYINLSAGEVLRERVSGGELDRLAKLRLDAKVLLLDAWAATRSDDSKTARQHIDEFLTIVKEGPGGYEGSAMYLASAASALAELGDEQQALDLLEQINYTISSSAYRPRILLGQARLAARLGLNDKAVTAYESWLKLRRYADPSQKDEIDAVRVELGFVRENVAGA